MGYLRRDKIQSKIVELLAIAASGNSPVSPLLVDESALCGSPGKVVDAFTLYNILEIPANRHIFYGDAGSNPRFPDPRDFKLAVVDKPSGIYLRVGFLSPALTTVTIEVRLLIAIGVKAWPSTSNFPFRTTLNHSDSVLYHRAAQTGMYLTGYGVHSSAWQIRLPAAESFLEKHYSTTSAVNIILQTLCTIPREIDEEYRRHQVVYRILNSYIMRSCTFYELEHDLSEPSQIILNWGPSYISTIVLKILDKLINSLRSQTQPNYFFPQSNLFVNPGHLCEDDFLLESNKIKAYMLKMFDMSLTSLSGNEDFNEFSMMKQIEGNLLEKWRGLVDGLLPVESVRKSKCCRFSKKRNCDDMLVQYTSRQVEYIGIVLKNMLIVKHHILQSPDEIAWAAILKITDNIHENAIEDIIYILAALIQQARDEYIQLLLKNPKTFKTVQSKRLKIDEAITKLMEVMRKENDFTNVELLDDTTLVTVILKWLHKGLDHSKYLKNILEPYLKRLFVTSQNASWHLETINRNEVTDEVSSLCMFAMLVNTGKITPGQGIVDSISKNWIWAKKMLDDMEDGQLRLIFVPDRGKVTKHIISLPPNEEYKLSKSMHNLKVNTDFPTLSKKQCYFSTLLVNQQGSQKSNTTEDYVPPHCKLRDNSPMQLTLSKLQRRGEHRCSGDVLATLVAMQKINVVREVSTSLPNEEYLEILDAIQKLQVDRTSKSLHKSKSNSFIQLKNSNLTPDQEKYTPKEESAGIKDGDDRQERENLQYASRRWDNKDAKSQVSTLIGSCRAARIREDNGIVHLQNNFKMRSLMKHSSFKY